MSEERRREIAELVCAIVFVAVGTIAAAMSVHYGLAGRYDNLGPGATPFAAGLVMLVLAAAVAVRSALRLAQIGAAEARGDASTFSPAGSEAGDDDAPADPAKPWKVIGLTFAAAVLASWVGQVAAFSLLIFVLLVVLERTPVLRSLAVAAASGAAVWLIFSYFLEIPLS